MSQPVAKKLRRVATEIVSDLAPELGFPPNALARMHEKLYRELRAAWQRMNAKQRGEFNKRHATLLARSMFALSLKRNARSSKASS